MGLIVIRARGFRNPGGTPRGGKAWLAAAVFGLLLGLFQWLLLAQSADLAKPCPITAAGIRAAQSAPE